MLARKILNSKKAISPILATLLLIVIAVAAIVVTYAWIMTYMGSAGQQAGVRLWKANVSFYTQGGTKKIDIDIQNTGTSDTQIIQVYAGPSAGNTVNQTTTPSLPLALPAAQIRRVTITYNWTATVATYFKVVSSSGQSIDWVDTAPSS
jgi:flagellin-like protein